MRGMLSVAGSNEKYNNTRRSSVSRLSSLVQKGSVIKKTHTGVEVEEEKVKGTTETSKKLEKVFGKARTSMVQSNNYHAH